LTLHAPFFQGRYFPESHVLEALLLYENCRYAEARRALQEFQGRYRPVHDSLARALQSMPTAQTVADALTSGPQTLLASEKELAAEPRQSIPAASRRPRTQVDDDEELWPFQGEYWRDELGSYRFQLSDRCAHQPKAPPPQEAGLPARAPAAAASAESAAPA